MIRVKDQQLWEKDLKIAELENRLKGKGSTPVLGNIRKKLGGLTS